MEQQGNSLDIKLPNITKNAWGRLGIRHQDANIDAFLFSSIQNMAFQLKDGHDYFLIVAE